MPGNPNSPTFPGVYIKEIPSGVRTITGVATSITAFIGRARLGPEDEPLTINSFSDFVRNYGGLWELSKLGYAVKDFFLNGGSQAVIVRVSNGATPAKFQLPNDTTGTTSTTSGTGTGTGTQKPTELTLVAASTGKWANTLEVSVDHDTSDPTNTKLFNLTIFQLDPASSKVPIVLEQFFNLSVDDNSPRYVPRVLKQSSQYLRVPRQAHPQDPNNPWDVPDVRPAVTTAPAPTGGTTPAGGTTPTGGTTPAGGATAVGTATATTTQNAPVPIPVTTTGDDGSSLTATQVGPGITLLDKVDLFNILCIPPYLEGSTQDVDLDLLGTAAKYCKDRRAMLLVDPPLDWNSKQNVLDGLQTLVNKIGSDSATNAALFFPRIRETNILFNSQIQDFAPSGAIAGIFARTDAQRGVWKAPAGLDASLTGVSALSVLLTDDENGELNPLGVNCLRTFPAAGQVIWGSRTLAGNDRLASEWKYIPVRRTALYIEESLFRGTQWVVFEPNDEPLWAQIRLNVGAFMHNLFRKGAFQGKTPREAYFVKCDGETTTQNDIDNGIVNIVVGFAPLKPAEFVIISIQQMAGQIQV